MRVQLSDLMGYYEDEDDLNSDIDQFVSEQPDKADIMDALTLGWSVSDSRPYNSVIKNEVLLQWTERYPQAFQDSDVFDHVVRNYFDNPRGSFNYLPVIDHHGLTDDIAENDDYYFRAQGKIRSDNPQRVFQNKATQDEKELKHQILKNVAYTQHDISEAQFTHMMKAGIANSSGFYIQQNGYLSPHNASLWTVSKAVLKMLKPLAEKHHIYQIAQQPKHYADPVLDYAFAAMQRMELYPPQVETRADLGNDDDEPDDGQNSRYVAKDTELNLSDVEQRRQRTFEYYMKLKMQIEHDPKTKYGPVDPKWKRKNDRADSVTLSQYPRRFRPDVKKMPGEDIDYNQPVSKVDILLQTEKYQPSYTTSRGYSPFREDQLFHKPAVYIFPEELKQAQQKAMLWAFCIS